LILLGLQIAEVCLVANLQTLGPIYVGDASNGVFHHNTGTLLAARLIVTSGMANDQSPSLTLHGPIPITELDLPINYSAYYFISPMKQQPDPKTTFSTGTGSFIICIIVNSEEKNDFRPFEETMQNIIAENATEIDFSSTISGEIDEEVERQIEKKMKIIFQEINESLSFGSLLVDSSLFDIGLLANLPDDLAKAAKKLVLFPKGIKESEFNSSRIIRLFSNSGLIKKEIRDGEVWLIPR